MWKKNANLFESVACMFIDFLNVAFADVCSVYYDGILVFMILLRKKDSFFTEKNLYFFHTIEVSIYVEFMLLFFMEIFLMIL